MARRTRQPPVRPTVGGSVISSRVPPYAARWHRVDEWAESSVMGDREPIDSRNARIAGWRGVMVLDINNEEEAYERGTPVEMFGDVPIGPDRIDGGTRRVSIRLFTWVVDARRESAYAPSWITSGVGMSAAAASHAHSRYVEWYALQVARGIESRRLTATAMEIVFWTAGSSTDYV